MCLGNIPGDFSASNMKTKKNKNKNKKKETTGLNGCEYDFSVDYRAFDTSNIIDIHKDLMKKHDIE